MRGNTITITMPLKRGKMAKSDKLFQYDYGQKLLLTGVDLPEYYEVHFSNELHGTAVTSIGDSTGVNIPDNLLATGDSIYLWLFLHDDVTDGETEFQGVIPVIKRAQVNDQITPYQQTAVEQAIVALNAATGKADAAVSAIQNMGVEAEGTDHDSPASVIKTIDPETGEVTLTFIIPEGAKGDKGDTGATGAKGDPGDPAELIDDDAGVLDLDKAWSASKLTSEFSDVLRTGNAEGPSTIQDNEGGVYDVGYLSGDLKVAVPFKHIRAGDSIKEETVNKTVDGKTIKLHYLYDTGVKRIYADSTPGKLVVEKCTGIAYATDPDHPVWSGQTSFVELFNVASTTETQAIITDYAG
jgi:hypothetical protein